MYPAYRDSGVDFLGRIPASWTATRIANVFEERKVFNHPDEMLLSIDRYRGIIKQSETGRKVRAPKDRAGYKLIEEGQLGYNILNAFMGSVGISKYRGIVSPAYAVARLRTQQDPWYFHYLLRTGLYQRQFNRFSYGIMYERNRLYYDRFKVIPIPLPPKEDQEKIVAFLRAQDTHIARLIKAKRDLIGLLTEQKLHIIDHAVTRGINASAALKPSGVEWLGDVPAHWEISRLGACVKTNRAGVWGSDPADKNQPDQLICVRVADFDIEKLAVGTSKLTVRAVTQSERSGRLLCSGDILLEKSGGGDKTPVGRVVAFTLDEVSVCSNFVARLVPNTQIVRSAFLLTLMNHLHARRIVTPYIKQTTGIQNLDSTTYFKLGIVLPSLDEQDEILQVLAEQCRPLEEAIQRANEEIKLIREYRDRQIADVVTGQVDARGWVPGPDDVVAEEYLAALAGDEEIDTDGEEDDGDE